MKFLHLSDLHIGKNVNGFSMLEEQRHAFDQILTYIQKDSPDAILIAGDIYDRAVPGVEAVCVFDDFLTALAKEQVAVLLIAGNHDSPERLAYASRLLEDKKIHLCGVFDGKMPSVTLTDEYGEVHFWLLPFIRPATIRGLFNGREIETYGDAISAILDSTTIDNTKRNVLLSHQFYIAAGVLPLRSESEINPIGGLDAIDAELLSNFDYVALGHLHGGQRVGSENIRYAGSPVKYSLSEWKHNKSALLIEIKEKNDLSVTALPLTPIHEMRKLTGRMEALISDGKEIEGGREDYLHIILTDDEEIVDPMGKLRTVYPNVMALDFENLRTHIDINSIAADEEKVNHLSPYELFSEFFLETSGAVMSTEQAKLVRDLLDEEELSQ